MAGGGWLERSGGGSWRGRGVAGLKELWLGAWTGVVFRRGWGVAWLEAVRWLEQGWFGGGWRDPAL